MVKVRGAGRGVEVIWGELGEVPGEPGSRVWRGQGTAHNGIGPMEGAGTITLLRARSRTNRHPDRKGDQRLTGEERGGPWLETQRVEPAEKETAGIGWPLPGGGGYAGPRLKEDRSQ